MLPEERAYSRRFIRPSDFTKLDTLTEGHERIAECKNHNAVTSIYGVTSLLNFGNKKLVRNISLKVLKEIESNLTHCRHQKKCRMQES